MRKLFLYLLFVLFINNYAWSHPVSSKGLYGIMPSYMHQRSELELNFSFENNKAFGVSLVSIDDGELDREFILPRFNYRILRINEINSQFNIYLSGGLGGNNESVAGLGSFQIDYETRHIYTLVLAERIESEADNDFTWFRYRIGVAPYLSNFEGFHTWIIAQVDYMPELKDEITFTPMLRFFYLNYLLETGVSTRGEFSINGIFHF